MNDDEIMMRGGDEEEIRKYAEQNGADLRNELEEIANPHKDD